MPMTEEEKAYILNAAISSDPSHEMSTKKPSKKVSAQQGIGKSKLVEEIKRLMGGLSEEESQRILETNPYLNVPPERLQLGTSLIDHTVTNNQLMKLSRKKKGKMIGDTETREEQENIFDPYAKENSKAVIDGEFYRELELPKVKKVKAGSVEGKVRKVSEWNLFVKKVSKWPGLSGFGGEKIKVMSKLYKIAKTENGLQLIEKMHDASFDEIQQFVEMH